MRRHEGPSPKSLDSYENIKPSDGNVCPQAIAIESPQKFDHRSNLLVVYKARFLQLCWSSGGNRALSVVYPEGG